MAIDVGDRYRLHFRNLSPAGDLVSATTMTVTITLPDATTSGPHTVAAASTGVYFYDFDVTQAGRHRAVWTGTPYGVHGDVFDARSAAVLDLISVAAAKKQVGIAAASTAHDDELRDFIAGITAAIEGPDGLGMIVVRRSFTEVRDVGTDPVDRIAVAHVPVVALTALADVNDSVTYDIDDWVPGPTGATLRMLRGGTPMRGLVQLTYTAGLATPPDNVGMAARVMLQEVWRTQRADSGGPRYTSTRYGSADDAPAVVASKVLSPAVRQLLGGDNLTGLA